MLNEIGQCTVHALSVRPLECACVLPAAFNPSSSAVQYTGLFLATGHIEDFFKRTF